MAPNDDDEAVALLSMEEVGQTRMSVRLPIPVYQHVCRLADMHGVSCSAVVRTALTLMLRKMPSAGLSDSLSAKSP